MKKGKMTAWAMAGAFTFTSITGSMGLFQTKAAAAEAATQQPDYESKALRFYQAVHEANFEKGYALFSESLKKKVSVDQLPVQWQRLTAAYGIIHKTEKIKTDYDGVHTNITLLCTAGNGPFELIIRFNDKGMIDDLFTTNDRTLYSYQTPTYDSKTYKEKPLVIGDGEFALPAVLTIPEGKGPFPAVVLVHGSGPNDQDESMFSYKIFRDIAVGLASRGIAVLRYDKRTYAHHLKAAQDPAFGIQKETVLDANLAVALLKEQPEIDAKQLFVLGHSQGGYALPLIIANDEHKDIKGVIGAAAPAQKFQDLLLWQFEQALKRAQANKLPAEQLKQLETAITQFKEQINLLNDRSYTTEHLPKNFMLGDPYWWYDIRDYIPSTLAKEQTTPMLLIQGTKDLQVPSTELDIWKNHLKERNNVQYKTYKDMFHTLGNYAETPDLATEYMTPGNVSEEMIKDVATWITTGKIDAAPQVDLDQYSDYKPGLYWSEAFAWALAKGIIVGYREEKKLKPDQPMTELQYLQVYFRYTLGSDLKDQTKGTMYSLAAKAQLPVKNKPFTALTRGEAAVLLADAFTHKKRSERDAVKWLFSQGIVKGYSDEPTYESFKPQEPISRAHLMTMFYHLDMKQSEMQ
ncbi:alpha/beta fold hydrolase [Bacillus testis]|uniref:alpha/beta fold hydrolase n=1 Tax=Bacillus testis TaxID=1622072 RepID=UPI00067E76E3|nr:alpha/beta fold hydrolase [Bacillus testis]